jgi:hypothetical protein
LPHSWSIVGACLWDYQYDTFNGHIPVINISPDLYTYTPLIISHSNSKAIYLFSPELNSPVLEISNDIKLLKITNG